MPKIPLRPLPRFALFLALAAPLTLPVALTAQTNPESQGWHAIPDSTPPGHLLRNVLQRDDGKVPLPPAPPEVTDAFARYQGKRLPLKWTVATSASPGHLELPAKTKLAFPISVEVETTEKSGQLPGGRITLLARDAHILGSDARLESAPGDEHIGVWSKAADVVQWDYKPSRWGMYDISLTGAAEAGEGTTLTVEVAGKTFTVTRPVTGSWDRYITIPVGRIYIAREQPISLKVSCAKLAGDRVMNLKAISLHPAPENGPIIQSGQAPLTLHASNAITHSVTMRFEPAANKNCLGYWVNAKDWAEWQFTVNQPGDYTARINLGCGKGQGGSEIAFLLNGQTRTFLVPDTGDYHTHTILDLGVAHFAAPGDYSVSIKPLKKKAGAIMDIEEITLSPVTK